MSTTNKARQTRSQTRGASVAASRAGSEGPVSVQAPSIRSSSRGPRNKAVAKTADAYGAQFNEDPTGQLLYQNTTKNVAAQFDAGVANVGQGNVPSGPSGSDLGPTSNRRSLSPVAQTEQVHHFGGHNPTQNDAVEVTGAVAATENTDGATVVQRRAPEFTLGQIVEEDEGDAAVNPSQSFPAGPRDLIGTPTSQGFGKNWMISLTMVVLALACLVSEIFYGPILGAKHDLFRVRSQLRDIIGNGLAAAPGMHQGALYDDSLRQRLDLVEAELFKLTNSVPAHEDKYKIDFFDPRNAAAVWPKYTSPEKMRAVGGFMGFFQRYVPFSEAPRVQGPFADVKKMWCAPSEHGQAQVAVLLPGKMIPKKLVIEQTHTIDQALDLSTYPYSIELWARPHPDSEISKDEPVPDEAFPTSQDQNRPLDPAHTLPDGFIKVGSWQYDISSKVAKQVFVPQKEFTTTTVAVRVTSNWGNTAQTCMHKLQLFGENLEPEKAYILAV